MSRQQNAALDYALGVPTLAPFAMFEVDLGAITGTDGKPVYPELEGKYTPLWEVDFTPPEEVDRVSGWTMEQWASYAIRCDRVVKLANKYDGVEWDTPDPTPVVDSTPQDEWFHFWGGDSPTKRREAEFAAE